MKVIYAYSIMDIKQIYDLGFDTILGTLTIEQLDELSKYNMKCIYSGSYIEHDNIISYYLYDEPDVNNINIEEQDIRIAEFRSKTTKPLSIALIEPITIKCSQNFDWYLMDIYYSSKLSKLKNYLNIAISSQFLKIQYPNKVILPILGLYDDNLDFKYSTEITKFATKFKTYFKGNNHVVFLWNNSIGFFNGVANTKEYQDYSKELNSKNNKYAISNYFWYPLAWVFLKINNLLGKRGITI